jgi:catechol 2,3-dioxygenase-like lactoylglutathione lyase family enzyme
MENLIAKLLGDFERGKMDRRQLIQSLTMASVAASAAATIAAPVASAAGPSPAAAGIHHISYQVADYRRTRDLYAEMLGTKITDDNGKQCMVLIGSTKLVLRNGTGATPQIDHMAYVVDNWNKAGVEAELKRRGLNPKPDGEEGLQFNDPDGFHIQLLKNS